MNSNHTDYTLIYVIVNFGAGSKVLKTARQSGVAGGTVFLGMGTMKNRILEFLELTDIRKEIVIMAAEKSVAEAALNDIGKKFELHKPYHGIAFTIPLPVFIGSSHNDYIYRKYEGDIMYHSIMAIVEKGKAEFVMEAATNAGARGGTIINARGAGSHETKLFNMEIEPEKEIVLILSASESTEKIAAAIRDHLEIGSGGNGVIFCQDVSNTIGIS